MMRTCANRRGFTLLEVLAASGVMALLLICIVSMMTHALRTCNWETAQVTTDNNAIVAMGYMIDKVKEAKEVHILDGPDSDQGPRLSVVMPANAATYPAGWAPYYDRTVAADTAHPYMFYLSDSTGTIGRAGTWLWRTRSGERSLCVRRDVEYLWFQTDTKKSIMITVRTKDRTYDPLSKSANALKTKYSAQTELTERVVYLRNY